MVGSLAGAAASQKVTEVRNVGVARVLTRCNTCNSVPQLTEAGTPASAIRPGRVRYSDPVLLRGKSIA